MSAPFLVTAALPYANGSIHIGHLLEHTMTDMYVRALRLAGEDALYICADDTHGTPVELSAAKAGVTPEEFVARCAEEHLRDYTRFGIRFDSFYSTNSPENRRWSNEIYNALKQGGYLERKPMEQFYDEVAGRFLPDRFVKGTCPKCGAQDQYGDVCESCRSTYQPTELVNPYSVLDPEKKRRPVLRISEHIFVQLGRFTEFLREWSGTPGRLQPEIKRFVDAWLEQGLQSWCISRDAPYFGFEIPDEPGKYFYVWLDAPIGYISSTENWANQTGRLSDLARIWRQGDARVEHVLGKDIIYFHTLFWPAMLHAAGLKTPDRVHVHGMLTVDGVKMSKSRGTFITAATFSEHVDPTYLRYYYASKIGASSDDVDLSLDEIVNRVNAELVNNLANLVSRAISFLATKLDGRYGPLPANASEYVALANQKAQEAEAAYRAIDLASATRAALELATLGNKLFQDNAPWLTLKTDPEAARSLVTLCANLAKSATVLLAPAVPALAAKIYGILGLTGEPTSFSEAKTFDLVDRRCGTPERIIDRLEKKALEAALAASRAQWAALSPAEETKAVTETSISVAPFEPLAAEINIDQFGQVDLRAGLVLNAEKVDGAKKLLKLTIDLGEGRHRTIFAGIREAYDDPTTLIGKKVPVVANLAPRQMKWGTSEGMVLAAGPGGKDVWVLEVPAAAPPGAKIK